MVVSSGIPHVSGSLKALKRSQIFLRSFCEMIVVWMNVAFCQGYLASLMNQVPRFGVIHFDVFHLCEFHLGVFRLGLFHLEAAILIACVFV